MKHATYQPKGSMCMACVHARNNCEDLAFPLMQVVEVVKKTNAAIVKCSQYEPKPKAPK
jgi:hypothetical protein